MDAQELLPVPDNVFCTLCQRHLPAAAFAPSSLARKIRRCRRCHAVYTRAQRHLSPEHEAAHCLYEMERRRFGQRRGVFSVAMVTRVLDKFGRQSVLSDARDNLRLRRFWPDLPFSEWNAVVLTARENNAVSRSRRWLERFPPAFVETMRAQRVEHDA